MDFRFEESRLESFVNWTCPYVQPADLASAGFYYTGQIDRVRCFECSMEICTWTESDDPMVEHQRWGGRCRFIRGLPCGNVAIGMDPTSIPSSSRDVYRPYRLEYRTSADADNHRSSHRQQQIIAKKLGCLGISIARRAENPAYASYEARLQTFTNWPAAMIQTKEDLADAGFFYSGASDLTTCYHCGGGYKNWELGDNPWIQHAKWFPLCYYVRLVKGQKFINSVTGKHVRELSKKETRGLHLSSNVMTAPRVARTLGDWQRNKQQQQEKNPIDDSLVCKICCSEELGVVFLPCGHLVTCVKCAPSFKICAICRANITLTVRTFLS